MEHDVEHFSTFWYIKVLSVLKQSSNNTSQLFQIYFIIFGPNSLLKNVSLCLQISCSLLVFPSYSALHILPHFVSYHIHYVKCETYMYTCKCHEKLISQSLALCLKTMILAVYLFSRISLILVMITCYVEYNFLFVY